MEALYIPLDGKFTLVTMVILLLKLKLDNSLGGRELKLGLRVDGELVTNGWWENKRKVSKNN